MAKRHSPAVLKFVQENAGGRTTDELLELVSIQFGPIFTRESLKTFKSNHKICSGTPTGHRTGEATKQFPAPVRDFILENYKGTGHKAMAEVLNARFGTTYTASRIKSFYGNHKLDSGLSGQFPQGHTPANKGKKGISYPGMETTQFPKGNKPWNYRPVGTERVDTDGYVDIKVADPNKWRPKHILLWEAANGPVPEGHALIFADGNKLHVALGNLVLVSRAELVRLNQNGLIKDDADLTRSGILVADIIAKCSERKKKLRRVNQVKKEDAYGQA